jgi:AraC-like DNA-binding protein
MYITLIAINLATIFLSLTLLFFHRHKIINVLFLSFSLIAISIAVIVRSIIFFDNSDRLVALVFNNFSSIYYLIGPFFYLHIRSYLNENCSLKKIDFVHFVPVFLHLVNISPYLFTSFAHKIEVARSIQENILAVQSIEINIFSFSISSLFPPIIILGYGFYCIYLMMDSYKTERKNNLKGFKIKEISFGWLIYTCFIIILIMGVNLFVSYNLGFSSNQIQMKPFALFQSILLISIPVSLILSPQVLYGIHPQKRFEIKEKSANIISLPVQIFDKLSERIHEMMKKDKPFLSSDFSLDDLVSLLNVPKHHVYHCLKETMKIKFTDLRSQYRVEHAKELLVDLSKKNITIEAIGLESGFPTRSSFYRAFKLETGITPKEFVARELL